KGWVLNSARFCSPKNVQHLEGADLNFTLQQRPSQNPGRKLQSRKSLAQSPITSGAPTQVMALRVAASKQATVDISLRMQPPPPAFARQNHRFHICAQPL